MNLQNYNIKHEVVIRLFCVIVLAIICLLIYWNGKGLDCSSCYVDFSTTKRDYQTASNEELQDFSVQMNLLYSNLNDGHCIVVFNKDDGYRYNENITHP